MCTVSDKLKLCTCGVDADEIYKMPNYWVFYKYEKDRTYRVLGMPYFPETIKLDDHNYNLKHIPKMLNEGNVFDFEIQVKHKDRLLLRLTLPAENGREAEINYGFEYRHGKWINKEYDYFTWADKHVEDIGGIVKNVISEE
jgi:hypothetical protein